MLKYPLKKEILLITESGDYVCKISYAGSDTLICKDVYKRIYTQESGINFFDVFISEELILERNKSCGFSYIEEEEKEDDLDKFKNLKNTDKNKKSKLLYLKEASNDRKI